MEGVRRSSPKCQKVLRNVQCSMEGNIQFKYNLGSIQFSMEDNIQFIIWEICNFLWRGRTSPEVSESFLGQKEEGGGMDAGLLFKAGNDLFGRRSISGKQKPI